MQRALVFTVGASSLLFLASCSMESTTDPDGSGVDGGRADGGRIGDAGPRRDSGMIVRVDAGPQPDDAGTSSDAGGGTDAGATDAGSTTSDAGMDGGPGAGSDAGTPDAGPPRTLACGASTCTGADICCVTFGAGGSVTSTCAATCVGGAVPVECYLPSDCGGNPCCGTITSGALTSARCGTMGTSCRPMINIGTQSGQTRGCTVDANCTSGPVTTSLDTCCTFTTGTYNVDLCFSPTLDALVDEITCP